jgi:BNR/Asp-box repeat./Beta-propeller repeat.
MKKKLARTGRMVGLALVIAGLMNWAALFVPASGAALRAHHSVTSKPAIALSSARPPDGKATPPERLCEQYNNLPLRFEAAPQASAPMRFIARNGAHNILLTASEARVALRASDAAGDDGSSPHDSSSARRELQTASVGWRLVGANRHARMSGEAQLPVRTNYFIGKDAAQWRSDVTSYARVRVEQVYRGVDVIYYGAGPQLEYDFNVAARADYKAIRLRFIGASRLAVDAAGDLVIDTPAGAVRHAKPVAYQLINGSRKEVLARYVVVGTRAVRFLIGEYDKRLPLVIDPVLSYSTHFGSRSGFDQLSAVAFDAAGNAYVVGTTSSSDLPTTPGALQPTNRGGDVFISKLNPAGTALVYATYLGGSEGDYGMQIAVDAKGRIYVAGATYSNDFPTTANAFQSQWPGDSWHVFVAALNATGTALDYATYLGGPDESAAVFGLAVDGAGQATVAGYTSSTRFPTTPDALQPELGGNTDAFIARLNRDGSALVYATYLGGDSSDSANCLALDATGNAYIAGDTNSTNFPTTRHAYQRMKKSDHASFVAKISAAGDRLAYSTFLNGDSAFQIISGIAIDLTGNAYVTGSTYSSILPATPGAPQTAPAGDTDAFVTKLNPTGSGLVYSTFLGGSGADDGYAIAVDSLGQAYVTGCTRSADFPLMKPFQSRKLGGPLFKSTDSSGSWEDAAAMSFTLNSLVVDPQVTSTLYASTSYEIIKSTDGGASFRVIAPGVSGTLVIDPVRPGVLYAFGGQRVYKSTDAGANWQRTDFSLPFFFDFSALVIDPKTPDTLYLSAYQYAIPDLADVRALAASFDVLFKSTDGGTSWTAIDTGLNVFSVPCLAIDPQRPTTLYASIQGREVIKSTDGGKSWAILMVPNGFFSVSRLVVDPSNSDTLYAISLDGLGYRILKSRDGGASWGLTALKLSLLTFLAIDPQTPATLYAGGFGPLYQTTDGGGNWRTVFDKVFVIGVTFDPKQPSTIYAVASPTRDMFVTKLNAAGTALIYSTYLGGLREESIARIAADAYGNAYVAGVSASTDFPVTPNAYQPHASPGNSGVVLRIADPLPLHITNAVIKGKKLLVSGEGFDQGAVITLNDADIATDNDGATPSILLISKRGGKQIARGQTVVIRVRNADGALSNEFAFKRSFE